MNYLFAVVLYLLAGFASAHDRAEDPKLMELDQLMTAFGWDMEATEIRSQKVADNLYVLFGTGGNIGVSIGPQGVLIVDDQFPQMIPKINNAISELGGNGVDFAINTHWHFDHAEGNLALGASGTWLVSQANSRQKMLGDHIINLVGVKYKQSAYPQSALPVITFDDRMQFHFNGQQIDLLHFGPAHTTGDAAIIFRGSNAVHLGDVFNRSYPFIDADNGGGIAGMTKFCKAVLAEINTDTIVIPGHGEVSDYQGLANYIAMLEDVHQQVTVMVKAGKSLDQVLAAKPTAKYDAIYGNPNALFLDRVYASIKTELAQSTHITFWNGNKSAARQAFEKELLQASLKATATQYGSWTLNIDSNNYSPTEEGNIFSATLSGTQSADVLVTVAGNTKFNNKPKIMISQPLTKGLLGYRLLMVKDQSLPAFRKINTVEDLQALSIGIPESWADAELFRQNAYSVTEKGSFDDLFIRLKKGEFDYTALGANEIEAAFEQRVAPVGGISIEPTMMIYYPFPLVFYVNPDKPELAERLEQGLKIIQANGDYDKLFIKHHGDVVERLNLKNRKVFTLKNPILPKSMSPFQSTLLSH